MRALSDIADNGFTTDACCARTLRRILDPEPPPFGCCASEDACGGPHQALAFPLAGAASTAVASIMDNAADLRISDLLEFVPEVAGGLALGTLSGVETPPRLWTEALIGYMWVVGRQKSKLPVRLVRFRILRRAV